MHRCPTPADDECQTRALIALLGSSTGGNVPRNVNTVRVKQFLYGWSIYRRLAVEFGIPLSDSQYTRN